MRYSTLTQRIQNNGASAWATHTQACQALERGDDVIVLSVGDPDFSTPTPIITSAIDALQGGDTHYPAIAGRETLRRAVASDFSARTGCTWYAENVAICAGTQNALLAAALCLLDHGDEVIALEPMYVTYESTLRMSGAELVTVAQHASSGFRPDVEAIAAAVTERTRVLVLTTPNNPTGVVMSDGELESIAALAINHDLTVIVDEVYANLVFEGQHVSLASLPHMAERTVTVSSVSKSHAMTGWRCGWAIGPEDLIDHIANVQTNINYGVPGFVQEAAIAALTECTDSTAAMRETYRRRRDLTVSELAPIDRLELLIPQAGMYVMVNVGAYVDDMSTFVQALYDATGVSLLDGGLFGSTTRGWLRISFATDDASLVEGCRRLVGFLTDST